MTIRLGKKRDELEMEYEKEQLKRQNWKCPVCKKAIRGWQTTVWINGVIYHGSCGIKH